MCISCRVCLTRRRPRWMLLCWVIASSEGRIGLRFQLSKTGFPSFNRAGMKSRNGRLAGSRSSSSISRICRIWTIRSRSCWHGWPDWKPHC
uniref:Putative secreted protein n=1 Tax=Anopheles darlingi TaxID=43151 RepID=A0A2M4D7X2_ANODA